MDDLEFISFDNAEEEVKVEVEVKRGPPALLTSIPAPWLSHSVAAQAPASHLSPLPLPPFVHLHNEMLTFCEYIAPTPSSLLERERLRQETARMVKELWPEATVHVFGSQLTNILTPTSDLDIAVLGVPLAEGEDMSTLLTALANKIKHQDPPVATYVEAIKTAKVPIVKFDHMKTGISVDICLNNDSGLRTGATIRKLVEDYPPLRPLTIVLKIFLAQRNMNEPYSGGMGSFVLAVVVASFLQMRHKQAHFTKQSPSWNLGALLLEFFQLYGNQFNYMTVGISIKDGGSYFNKRVKAVSSEDPSAPLRRPNMLYIENPEEPDVDMGGASYMMPKIKRSFEHAYSVLSAALSFGASQQQQQQQQRSRVKPSNVESYLAFVIRADDPSLADRHKPIDLIASGEA